MVLYVFDFVVDAMYIDATICLASGPEKLVDSFALAVRAGRGKSVFLRLLQLLLQQWRYL